MVRQGALITNWNRTGDSLSDRKGETSRVRFASLNGISWQATPGTFSKQIRVVMPLKGRHLLGGGRQRSHRLTDSRVTTWRLSCETWMPPRQAPSFHRAGRSTRTAGLTGSPSRWQSTGDLKLTTLPMSPGPPGHVDRLRRCLPNHVTQRRATFLFNLCTSQEL